MRNLLFIVAAGMLFLTACQEDDNPTVNAKNYYQAYELEYNSLEGETIARAFFKEKDATGQFLPLDDGAEVRVNGEKLEQESDLDATYKTTFPGQVDTARYEYADKDGNVYTNEFYMDDVAPIDFSPNTGPFNMFSSYDITWDGAPVQENEKVVFQLGRTNGGMINVIVDEVGANSFVLEDRDLMEVGKGQAKMALYRVEQSPLDDTNEAGGRMQLIHATGLVSVTIE